ncbi:MAG: HEAT repeat domain-containing protein [Elusimicrobia bacterium]|nr:HEAT repeat domain-containing protein [Elusimicrobiota bacterium]
MSSLWSERTFHKITAALQGHVSLQFVVMTSVTLFWLAALLSATLLLLRTYHRLREKYREGRKTLYRPGVEMAVLEAPLAEIVLALRPKRWGEAEIVQEVVLDAMRHLLGPPFHLLREATFELRLMERNLKALRSRSRFHRGRAMNALGLMRSSQAIVGILDILENEPLDMKLVALRALASIGDPAVLPYFIRISDQLSPAMMVRLASLMLEFGPPGRRKITDLIGRHPEAFPPRVMQDFLKELAADLEKL